MNFVRLIEKALLILLPQLIKSPTFILSLHANGLRVKFLKNTNVANMALQIVLCDVDLKFHNILLCRIESCMFI